MKDERSGAVTSALVHAAPDSVRATDSRGQTALHLAARGRSKAVVEKIEALLASCPAAVFWAQADGLSPLDMAQASGYRSGRVASLLERWARAVLGPRRGPAAPTPLASCLQRLAWAQCQHPRLGRASHPYRLSLDVVEMVQRRLCDRPPFGAEIAAALRREGFEPDASLQTLRSARGEQARAMAGAQRRPQTARVGGRYGGALNERSAARVPGTPRGQGGRGGGGRGGADADGEALRRRVMQWSARAL